MKNAFYTLILFQFISLIGFSQEIEMNGLLLDSKTNDPIQFANIGVFNKNKGTVSNIDGAFNIKFSKEFARDSLTLSHVLYETTTIPIKGSKNLVVQLKPIENVLSEVVLSNKKKKHRKIGVRTYNPLLWMSTITKDNDILESAKQIKIPNNKTVRVKNVNFYLRRGFLSDSALIRINFYKSKDNLPGERVVFENIIQNRKIKKGWINIDLNDYAVYLKEDFFIGVEIIPNSNKPLEVYMGAILTKGSGFMRTNSLGKWNKVDGAQSIYVQVEY